MLVLIVACWWFYWLCLISQGCVEAYGSYEEIQARGVELMEFIKTHSEDDDQEMFSIHQTDCDEAETNIIE